MDYFAVTYANLITIIFSTFESVTSILAVATYDDFVLSLIYLLENVGMSVWLLVTC